MEIPVGIKNAAFNAGLDEMKEQAAGFAESVSGLFAGIGIASLFEGALEKAKDIEELSKRIDDTAENVQKLGNAAKLMGVDMDTVGKGAFKAWAEAQKALGAGGAEMRKHFEDLGISMKQLAALKGPRDTILALAQAVHGAANQHKAFADATEIVGVKQAALIQMLLQGKEAIDANGNAFPIMGDKTVGTLAKAQRSLDRFKDGLTVITGWVLGELMGAWDRWGNFLHGQINMVVDDFMALYKVAEKIAHLDFKGAKFELKAGWNNQKADFAQNWNDLANLYGNDKEPKEPKQKALKGGPTETDEDKEKRERAAEEAGRKQEEQGEKRKRLMEEIAEIEEHSRQEGMTGEQKLNDLIRERGEAMARVDFVSTAGAEQRLKVAQKDVEIEHQKKENAEKSTEKSKQAAEKRTEYAKQLAEAQEQEENRAEEHKLKGMTPTQQRAFLKKKEDMLWYQAEEAEKKGDPLKASKIREQADATQDKIDGISRSSPTFAKVAVSSLRAVGGGGGIGTGGGRTTDLLAQLPLQTGIQRDMAQSLKTIVQQMKPGSHNNKPPVHPK